MKVDVYRTTAQNRHGDKTQELVATLNDGRVAWAIPNIDWEHKTVVMSQPTVYFKRYVPDIQVNDKLHIMGRWLTVTEVMPWEHPRKNNVIMGTEIKCSGGVNSGVNPGEAT